MKELRDWMALVAAIGHLSLAVTALAAGRKSPLARPVAALCFTLFGWNFATLGRHVFGADAFSVLDGTFTALTPVASLEVVLAFVGAGRRQRVARRVFWAYFGLLAASTLGGTFSDRLRAWADEPAWAAAFLGGWLPIVIFQVVLLVRHLGATTDAAEKARARTVLAALAIASSFGTSDIAHGLGLPLPYLGSIGTIIAAALLTTCAVRFELFERNVSARTWVYVIGMISAFVVVYLVVFRAFAGSLAVQAFASAVVTLLVVAVARELGVAFSESRERDQRLVVLGRFSAQMAHDIKGPITALLGATQVLEGEADDATRKELLALAADQAKRITAIVDRYDRMARIEPRPTLVRVNELARSVARAHGIADASMRLDPSDPECEADRDLLESALENVVRNAVEATGEGGDVRIETERDGHRGGVVLRVRDKGPGMDARQRERAFEDFFTTKAEGSGLGLAFVRRVLDAHGGNVHLTSELGVGTTVELRLSS
ncbi:MAG: ATP-binding protein [Labilithrix sp.]|nr:ATP-binding protein [Labilithrix sp.]